jgi:protein-S-isoprenylcysteine O-methyltransferase Ste14
VSTIGFVASRLLAARRNPGLIDERARSMELQGAKSWDRILAPLVALGGIFIAFVAGLDKRLEWSMPFEPGVKVASLVIIIFGYLLGTWAMLENKFFSGVVRIQTDRGHTVVSTGPYAWIRHPGYAGTVFVYMLTPILLDSIWSIIPALILVIALIVRTALEDKTLQDELPGYREFMQKTKYRLVPGIW